MANYIQAEDLESVVSEPLGFFPSEVACKPFLKWAGGKTQLLPELSKYIPASYNKYIEPFIGGGRSRASISTRMRKTSCSYVMQVVLMDTGILSLSTS